MSRAKAREAAEARAGVLKIVGVLVAVMVFGTIYWKVSSSQRPLDPSTLCPAEPVSVTVLLVDVTDPMNTAQRQDFQNQLTRLKNGIPRFGKLVVAKVDATEADLLTPVAVRCNPGTAADVSDWNGDRASLQRQWAEGFDEPLRAAFAGLASASGADRSPILESMQSVALTEFQRPGLERARKRLVVASDLLQNTDALSLYGGLPDARALVASPAFRRVRTDLRGVDVELWMLERADAGVTQPRALATLWERLVAEQGGEVSRIYNVSG